ncbi:MAG: GNAT family N-acetyltransferase [Cyanobacteria bacterium P01_A01_bin.40]
MQIRLFQTQDRVQVAQLFHDTVRQINIQDYSEEQVRAWSPDNIYFRNWSEVCPSKFTYIAEENDQIMGFGELNADGYIDCFYVHHLYQRQKVGSNIYQAIETKAQELNLIRLFTEASITAKVFFIKQGFSVIKQQQVFCRGQKFINFLMEKQLN